MKRIVLLLLLMCSVSAWAQDVIVKRDGSTIVCRVVEVNKSEVIYKRWGNLEGPNYVMNLTDISAVNFENGEKIRMDNQAEAPKEQKTGPAPTTTSTPQLPLAQKTTGQQTVSDDVLLAMTKKVKTPKVPSSPKVKRLKLIGYIGGPALVIAGSALFIVGAGEETGGDCFGGGAACIASGIALTSGCLIRAHNLKKKANSQYSVQSSPLYQYDFALKNGTSLSAGVDMLKDNTRRNPTLGVGLSYNF